MDMEGIVELSQDEQFGNITINPLSIDNDHIIKIKDKEFYDWFNRNSCLRYWVLEFFD